MTIQLLSCPDLCVCSYDPSVVFVGDSVVGVGLENFVVLVEFVVDVLLNAD
jgi:hypothetical protein